MKSVFYFDKCLKYLTFGIMLSLLVLLNLHAKTTSVTPNTAGLPKKEGYEIPAAFRRDMREYQTFIERIKDSKVWGVKEMLKKQQISNEKLLQGLFIATNKNDLKMFKILLNQNHDLLNGINSKEETPLIYSIKTKKLMISKYILGEKFKDKINILHQDIFGNTALMHAIFHGLTPVVRELVKKDFKIINIPDYNGTVPLTRAIKGKQITIAKYLIRHPKIDINHRDTIRKEPALIYAIEHSRELLPFIIMKKDIELNVSNKDDVPILALLMIKNFYLEASRVIKKIDNVDQEFIFNNQLHTSLSLATVQKNIKFINLFLNNNADLNYFENNNRNYSIFFNAISRGLEIKIIEKMIDHGANTQFKIIVGDNDSSIIFAALSSEKKKILNFVIEYLKTKRILEQEINYINSNGYSPLYITIIDESNELTNILLKNGASPKFSKNDGFSILLLSAYINDMKLFKRLLKYSYSDTYIVSSFLGLITVNNLEYLKSFTSKFINTSQIFKQDYNLEPAFTDNENISKDEEKIDETYYKVIFNNIEKNASIIPLSEVALKLAVKSENYFNFKYIYSLFKNETNPSKTLFEKLIKTVLTSENDFRLKLENGEINEQKLIAEKTNNFEKIYSFLFRNIDNNSDNVIYNLMKTRQCPYFKKALNKKYVNLRDEKLLNLAVIGNSSCIVDALLEYSEINNDKSLNSFDEFEMNPILYAAKNGNNSILISLLEAGADAEPIIDDNHKPVSPIMYAARRHDQRIVELLLEKDAFINGLTDQGETPLWFALTNIDQNNIQEKIDFLKFLVKKGANVTNEFITFKRKNLEFFYEVLKKTKPLKSNLDSSLEEH